MQSIPFGSIQSNKMQTNYQVLPDQMHMRGAIYENQQNAKDTLVTSLPEALKPFLRQPDANAGVEFVTRGPVQQCLHMTCAILLNVYSLCRMVLVRKGEIALTWHNGTPEILPAGRHILLSPANTLDRVVPVNEKFIKHGPIHIIRVGVGELGFGIQSNTGEPVLLVTGKHVIRSETFSFTKFINCTDDITELGNLKLVRVETGKVGYCYRGGELQILPPGLHVVAPPDRFGGFMSTQLSILNLPTMNHESSDYVPLEIRAAVFYRIHDPIKALTRIQNVQQQIRDTAISTLAGIIRSSSLADVASGNSQVKYEPNPKVKSDSDQVVPSAPQFYQRVHDEFIQKLADHVLEDWGIEIENIRIESLKIADAKLQESISKQAITINEKRSQILTLQMEQNIITAQSNNMAMQKRLAADADASATLAIAKADADAKIIRAEADKRAKILAGEGESEYSELLNKTTLGKELAVLQIQKECMSGIDQVMYVPHLPGMFQSGKGIFAANSGDLMPQKNA